MVADEMRSARRRLEELVTTTCAPDTDDVLSAFFGRSYTSGMLLGTLLDVLKEADMDEWPDETLDYYDVVRLPKDAEGEAIHVGDTIRLNDTTPRVFSLALYDDGWRVGFCGEHGHYSCLPKDVTHYHKPTLEEVLRAFATEWWTRPTDRCSDEILNDYSERVRKVVS